MIKDFIIPSKMYRSPFSHEINYDKNEKKIDSIISSANYFSRFFFNDSDSGDIFDYSKINLENKKDADKINNFYNSLNHEKIKGYSPLEKAIFLQKFLDKDYNYNDVLDNISAFDSLKESDKYFASIDNEDILKNVERFLDLDFLTLLKLKNNINLLFDSSNKYGFSKRIKGNKKVKNKRMEYSDIPFLSTKIIYEDFDYKFITKQYNVDERFSLESQKFIDIILYDFSGSMSSDKKRNIAKAFLLSYLENVFNNKSKLCFCNFIDGIQSINFIDSKEKGKEFFKEFIRKKPNGGLTNLDKSLKNLQSLIKENSFFELIHDIPNLTIINDGQDSVDCEKEYDLKINAVSIEVFNKDLETLCKKHNGIFIKKI